MRNFLIAILLILLIPATMVSAQKTEKDSCCGDSSTGMKECSMTTMGNSNMPALASDLGTPKRAFAFDYKFTLNNLPPDAKNIVAWVPVPPSNNRQWLADYKVMGNLKYKVIREPEYGNRYLEIDLSGNKSSSLDVDVTYTMKRNAYQPIAQEIKDDTNPASLKRYLMPDKLVPIDGPVAIEAKTIAANQPDNIAKARKIYDNIVTTVKYDKTGQGWGKGDANYACQVRAGNCSDFHSLFISETRALGIPSRFIIGFPIPAGDQGKIDNYQCWAEFYEKGKGWLPVDAAEASLHPEMANALFGGLDANRVEFTMGRDIKIPESKGDRLNYSIYPYVEVDGKPFNDLVTDFSYKTVPLEVKNAYICGMRNGCGTYDCDAASCSMLDKLKKNH